MLQFIKNKVSILFMCGCVVFSRLTLIKKENKGKSLFSCICGKIKKIDYYSVKNGKTRSCGCLRTERNRTGLNRLRHGDAKIGKVTRLHSIWRGMLKRCKSVKNYNGRGIKVCTYWYRYPNFKKWSIDNGYNDLLSIDRIDNNGNYSPKNCRWVDRKTQCRNRRTNKMIIFMGKQITLAELSEISGVPYDRLQSRITTLKWDVEKAVNTPKFGNK